jgi:hypothetical protein
VISATTPTLVRYVVRRAVCRLPAHNGDMCRSIQTLRPPFHEDPTADEIRAAALQYVRKISGFRTPAAHNARAFDDAVDSIAAATEQLLADLVVRGASVTG